MDPIFVSSVKEILRIDSQLRELRNQTRHLEAEREQHREILFEHIGPKTGGTSTRIQTPYGDIVIDERDRGVRFSVEDIRDILESSTVITREQREKLMTRFMEEEESLKTQVRTLSVKKPLTRRRHHQHRRRAKTEKHNLRTTNDEDLNPPASLNSMESVVSPDRNTFGEDPVAVSRTTTTSSIGGEGGKKTWRI